MWFFIFYRARQDGAVLLVSWPVGGPAQAGLALRGSPGWRFGDSSSGWFAKTMDGLQGLKHPWDH